MLSLWQGEWSSDHSLLLSIYDIDEVIQLDILTEIGLRRKHSREWEISSTRIQRPTTSNTFVGVWWFGAYQIPPLRWMTSHCIWTLYHLPLLPAHFGLFMPMVWQPKKGVTIAGGGNRPWMMWETMVASVQRRAGKSRFRIYWIHWASLPASLLSDTSEWAVSPFKAKPGQGN